MRRSLSAPNPPFSPRRATSAVPPRARAISADFTPRARPLPRDLCRFHPARAAPAARSLPISPRPPTATPADAPHQSLPESLGSVHDDACGERPRLRLVLHAAADRPASWDGSSHFHHCLLSTSPTDTVSDGRCRVRAGERWVYDEGEQSSCNWSRHGGHVVEAAGVRAPDDRAADAYRMTGGSGSHRGFRSTSRSAWWPPYRL